MEKSLNSSKLPTPLMSSTPKRRWMQGGLMRRHEVCTWFKMLYRCSSIPWQKSGCPPEGEEHQTMEQLCGCRTNSNWDDIFLPTSEMVSLLCWCSSLILCYLHKVAFKHTKKNIPLLSHWEWELLYVVLVWMKRIILQFLISVHEGVSGENLHVTPKQTLLGFRKRSTLGDNLSLLVVMVQKYLSSPVAMNWPCIAELNDIQYIFETSVLMNP